MTTAPMVRRRAAPRVQRRYGAGVLALASLVVGASNFLYALILTHGLTPTDYAIFMGAQALMVVNGLIGSAGIPWVLAKETAGSAPGSLRRREAITFAFWANVAFGLVTGAIVIVVLVCIGSVEVGLVVATATLMLAVGSTGLGLLQGEGRTELIAAVLLAEVVLKILSGSILVFRLDAGAAGAATSLLIGALPMLSTLLLVRTGISGPHNVRKYGRLWWSALRMSGLQVGVGVLASLDTLLVAVLPATRAGAAPYQAASGLGRAPLFIASAVSTAVFPTLTADQRNRRRVDGLFSYFLMATLSWALLVTVPNALIDVVFPAGYRSLVDWLPYTVTVGVGLGFLNILTAYAQSERSMRSALHRMAWAIGAAIVIVVVCGERWGRGGLAAGVLVGVWAAVVLMATLPSERSAVRILAIRVSRPAVWVAQGAILLVLWATHEMPAAWLAAALITGVITLLRAFPEFAGIRRSSAGHGRHRKGSPW